MPRLAVFVLAVIALGWANPSVGSAAVRSYAKLSLDEQTARQASEQHVVFYDKELATLDRLYQRHKMSNDEYQWKSDTVVFSIQQEAQFQDNLLNGRPPAFDIVLPDGVSKTLATVGKYSLGMTLAVLEGILKSGGNFSP